MAFASFETGGGGWGGGPSELPPWLQQRHQQEQQQRQEQRAAAFTPNPQLQNNQNIPPNAYNQPLPAPTPAPTPAPAPAPTPAPTNGGGEYNTYLRGLVDSVRNNDPSAGINRAFDLQTQQAMGAMGEQWSDQTGAMGRLPSDNTSQDLKAVLTGKVMAPLAAQRASALAGAQQQGIANQMSLAGLLGQHESQQASLAQQQWQNQFQQSQFGHQQSQDSQRMAWEREQAANAQRYNQQQFDWTRQQQLLQNQASGISNASGQYTPPPANTAPSPFAGPAPNPRPEWSGPSFQGNGGITDINQIWANANGGIPLNPATTPGVAVRVGGGEGGGGGAAGGDPGYNNGGTPGNPNPGWHLPGNAPRAYTPVASGGNPNAGATPAGTFPTGRPATRPTTSGPLAGGGGGAFGSPPMGGAPRPGGPPVIAPRAPAPAPRGRIV